jgi:hypothetical protein
MTTPAPTPPPERPALPDGWRPIETAPKNEEGPPEWVILYSTKEGVTPGYWGPTYFDSRYKWVQYNHRSEAYEVEGDITHWMALPPAPGNAPASPQPNLLQRCDRYIRALRQAVYGRSDGTRPSNEELDALSCVVELGAALEASPQPSPTVADAVALVQRMASKHRTDNRDNVADDYAEARRIAAALAEREGGR